MRKRTLRRDLTGKTFSRLTVIGVAFNKEGRTYYNCRCECGVEVTVLGVSLTVANTRSCGCLALEAIRSVNLKHGLSNHPMYGTWRRMVQRCYDSGCEDFKHYGGRGIRVCNSWSEFPQFLADMGERPEGATLERIENNDDYKPSNCRWASRLEQMQNTRRSRLVEYQGHTQTVTAWARELGMSRKTLSYRLSHYSLEDAFTKPVKPGAMLNGSNWRQQNAS